jgi:hypothetical protein
LYRLARFLIFAVVICGCLFQVSNANSESFLEDFNGTELDHRMLVKRDDGFTYELLNGRCIMEKEAGIGNGNVSIRTSFYTVGDFVTTVEAERINLVPQGELVLKCNWEGGGINDIFFYKDDKIHTNLLGPPDYGTNNVVNTAESATLRIRRVDNTLYLEYDTGSGFEVLQSGTHENFAQPTKFNIFLIQEFSELEANAGAFDNFSVQADSFYVPEQYSVPTTSLPLLASVLVIAVAWMIWWRSFYPPNASRLKR